MRLDQFLVENNYASSRTKSQSLIKEGKVKVDGKVITKSSFKVSEGLQVDVEAGESFVGRGALKLKAAIESFSIDPTGFVIADIGASTGGFTDYLLRSGANKSYCIDVGHDQLDKSIKDDARVINMEGINVRHGLDLPEKVDLVVADLSFISLKLVFTSMCSVLKEDGQMVVLFKPQFEVGKENVGKNGLVRDLKAVEQAKNNFIEFLNTEGYQCTDKIASPIKGGDGNQEYLFLIKRKK